MAREEFAYFELDSLPGLVEYFKTLRAPISPEDAVLVYITNALVSQTYVSMTRSGTVEPGVSDAYYEFGQWLMEDAPYNYWNYQEALEKMLEQAKAIPDLVKDYIGKNYDRIGQARELQKVILSEILSTLDIVQNYKTDEAKSILQIADDIRQFTINNPSDVKEFDHLLMKLYHTTWAFFTNIYRIYEPPVSDYAQNVGALNKLKDLNPGILEPRTIHLDDKDISRLFNSMFDADNIKNNQDMQVDNIKQLVKTWITKGKVNRNTMYIVQDEMVLKPTIKSALAYSVLLQPLQEKGLLDARSDVKRKNLTNSLKDFITVVYGTGHKELFDKLDQIATTKGDEFCDAIFALFDRIADDLVQGQEPVPSHVDALLKQVSVFIGFINRSNDTVWILPEVTKPDDRNNALGISKGKMLEKIHELRSQMPDIPKFIQTIDNTKNKKVEKDKQKTDKSEDKTAETFINEIFGPEKPQGTSQKAMYIKKFRQEISRRTAVASKLEIELRETLKECRKNNPGLTEEQLFLLTVSDVYVKYKGIYEANKNNIETKEIMEFAMRIVEPTLYVSAFFNLFKKDEKEALETLANTKVSGTMLEYIRRIAEYTQVCSSEYAQSMGHALQYMVAYSLQKVCDCVHDKFNHITAGIYTNDRAEANNKGTDFRMYVHVDTPTDEYITACSIDSKCDSNSTTKTGSATSNIIQAIGMHIHVKKDKWDDLDYKIYSINKHLQDLLPITLQAHPGEYKIFRTLNINAQIGLPTDVLETVVHIVNNTHKYSATNTLTDPENIYGKFNFPSETVEDAIKELREYYGPKNLSEHEALVLLQRDIEDLTTDLLHDNGISADDIEIRLVPLTYTVVNGKNKDALGIKEAVAKEQKLFRDQKMERFML